MAFTSIAASSRTTIACSSSRFLSEKFGMNGVTIPATGNPCTIRFCGILQKALVSPSSSRIKHVKVILKKKIDMHLVIRPFRSSVPSDAALIIKSTSSLASASHLSPFETPQLSDEWFALRKDKLTTSTFSTALGFWKGKRRFELWHEKVFASEAQIVESPKRSAVEWGLLNEAAAIERYKNITGHEVSSLGFAVHAKECLDWLGVSPDGLVDCFSGGGILEVKCPYNKGKPETGVPWSNMPFYYMPQVQGQMEIMDREWVDLYCWTPNGSTIFRVSRARSYWDLIHGILREYWWENVIPAREALLLEGEEGPKPYRPASTHKQTGLAIAKSIQLAKKAKLLCREIAGHVEFY